MKKIGKIISIVVSVFSSILLLYGSIKLAHINAATVPQEINTGIPGVEIVQPSKVMSNEDAQKIIIVAFGTLILGVVSYIASSGKEIENTN